MKAPAPRYAENGDTIDLAQSALGAMIVEAQDKVGEVTLTVDRAALPAVMVALRDTPGLEYQQLMEIAGVDYPERAERFDVCYHLLSLTRNHRLRVRVTTDEEKAVPSIVSIWPVAGWLEREVYDMYGVLFDGNPDLRRILTDYGFRGHPFRKDFPLSGFVELRYSEESKRVVYEPVKLAQDFRTFDFMSPWEGAQYVLPGDEKADAPPQAQAKGAPSPVTAADASKAVIKDVEPQAADKKVSETTADTGAGEPDPGNQARDKPVDPDVPSPEGEKDRPSPEGGEGRKR